MARYHTVIFDLDGTLADTIGDLREAVNHALACFSMPLRSETEMRRAVGNGIRKLIVRSLPAGTPENTADAVQSVFNAYYAEHLLDHTRPYDGIPELIACLRRHGIHLAVASNKFDAGTKRIVSDLFGESFGVVCGATADCPRKPAADIVERILTRLGVERQGTLLIGDSDVDAETAKSAGVDFLAVTWGFRSREQLTAAGTRHFAETAGEIERFILD